MQQKEKLKYVNDLKPFPMTNHEILDIAKYLNIPFFQGVFLRNELPKNLKNRECGILNLDTKSGTHWTAWIFNAAFQKAIYFDSYGNIQPPPELMIHLSPCPLIFFNYDRFQLNYGDEPSYVCGQWCLDFLIRYEYFLQK
jgi:hypothetical protein